jgi:competence transcription factor ComK
MEALTEQTERISANIKLVKTLLEESFEDAEISHTPLRIGGEKFKVELNRERMFLCISWEYLMDQCEARIRMDFEVQKVRKALSSNPGQYILLNKLGLNRVEADDVES